MKTRRFAAIFLVLSLCVAMVGCPPPTEKPRDPDEPVKENGDKPDGPGENGAGTDPAPVEPAVEDVPPPLTIPKVSLTQLLADTCLVNVGDKMPEGELQAVDGKAVKLNELYGANLTVVFFWRSDNLYSLDELKDLTAIVSEPFGQQGVNVVGINVGDTPEAVAAELEGLNIAFPVLLDPEGAYFGKVGTDRVTRTYLLNAAGTILWFDIEYSSTTRKLLPMAIKAVFEEEGSKVEVPEEEPAATE